MKSLVLTISLLASAAVSAQVYRWVDENGQVHYSDTPQEGAEEIVIPEVQTFQSPAPRNRSTGGSTASEPESEESSETTTYDQITVVSPSQEEVIWNTGGQVNVSVRTTPGIRPEHRLRILMDGSVQASGLRSGGTTLEGIERGTHTLRAEITDSRGTTIQSSDDVTFTVQQRSAIPGSATIPPPVPAPRPRPR